jgi:hypothetical protein
MSQLQERSEKGDRAYHRLGMGQDTLQLQQDKETD